MYRARALVASALPLASQCIEGRVLSLSNMARNSLRHNQDFGLRPVAVASSGSVRNYSIQTQESFLNGSSSNYLEEMYNCWLEDPKSVHVVSIYTK
jgi:hypothetical protein